MSTKKHMLQHGIALPESQEQQSEAISFQSAHHMQRTILPSQVPAAVCSSSHQFPASQRLDRQIIPVLYTTYLATERETDIQ